MQFKQLKLCITLLLGLGVTGLRAQESLLTSGSSASGSGGSVSYSVGQIVYTTNTGTNGSVSQGVQQPFEISVITGLEEAKYINLSVLVYPNPTANVLQLKIENEEWKDLSYQLFDLNGKLIETKKLEANVTKIVMTNLVPATYALKVNNNQKTLKSFKIIKY
jgi:hypothetical protein